MKHLTFFAFGLLASACSTDPYSVGTNTDPFPSDPNSGTTMAAVAAEEPLSSLPEQSTTPGALPTEAFTTAYTLRALVQQCSGTNEARTLAMYRCSGAFAELKRQGHTVPPDVDQYFSELNALNVMAFGQLGQIRGGSALGGGTAHKELDDLLAASPEKYDALLRYARLLKADKISDMQIWDVKYREEQLIIQKER